MQPYRGFGWRLSDFLRPPLIRWSLRESRGGSQGRGVAQDYIRAHVWANVAGAAGLEGARETRDYLRGLMTPNQLAEAQRLAREWLEKEH